jgi:choline-glycine betaine transporter
MYRKQKVRLFILCFSLFAFLLPIVTVILFPKQTLYLTKISYLFGMICLLTPFFPIWRWRIGGHQARPTFPIWQWVIAILVAEIGLISFFLIQNNVLLVALVQTGNIYPSNNIIPKVLLPSLFFNYGLFPWTLFAVVAIHFAYLGYTKSPYLTFSSHLFRRSKTFTTNIIRRVIDVYVQYCSKAFLLLMITFLSLQICLFFYPQVKLFTPLYSILVGSVLFLIFYTKTFQNILTRLEKRKVRQGAHLLAIWVISTFIVFLALSATKTSDQFLEFFQEITVPLSKITHPETSLALWNWSFWILVTPLFCSLLIKLSYGRTVKQLLVAMFILPASLLMTYLHYPYDIITNSISLLYTTHWIYLPMIISIILLTYFLLDKNLHTCLWLGFIPVQKERKIHRVPPNAWWGLSIVVMATTLVLHLNGVLLISMIGAPCLLIFLALLWHKSNKKVH